MAEVGMISIVVKRPWLYGPRSTWNIADTSLLSYYACSSWSPLASYPSQNKLSKLLTIAFKVLNFQQPSYLAALVPPYVPTRSLRSSSSLSICIPSRKTAMARSKSFSSVASDTWNKLPCHLSSISALPAFRKRLKHHLFSTAFPGISSSIHWHHALCCHHIHECEAHQMHFAA